MIFFTYIIQCAKSALTRPGALKDILRWYKPWKNSFKSSAMQDRVPWITFSAKEYLDSILDTQMKIFEYGAGGSTLFLAPKAERLISIEHDAVWSSRIMTHLASINKNHCEVRLLLPEKEAAASFCDPGDPQNYTSSGPEFKGLQFRKYVSSINEFPDDYFDLVIIDGRARPACIFHAKPKVKPGKYLLLDDSERPHYQKAEKLLEGWERHDFWGPAPYVFFFFQTTIWKRPS